MIFITLLCVSCKAFTPGQSLSEISTQHQKIEKKYITAQHLERCRKKVSEFTGTFGNSKYRLIGRLRRNPKLACAISLSQSFIPDDGAYAVYSAPVELTSGYGGIRPPKDSKFLWCKFKIENGKAILVDSSVGLIVNNTIAARCQLTTS